MFVCLYCVVLVVAGILAALLPSVCDPSYQTCSKAMTILRNGTPWDRGFEPSRPKVGEAAIAQIERFWIHRSNANVAKKLVRLGIPRIRPSGAE